MVEYRQECGNRPIVVATPSEKAVLRRLEEERLEEDEDITKYFDPYRGAHRPKSVKEIQGAHPDVLADI